MLIRSHRQESLARAYVLAVAAQAGVNFSAHAYDYGIDLSLRAVELRDGRNFDVGVPLDIQLKSTTRALLFDSHVAYDLDVRNYEDLRAVDANRARILVLFVMPEAEQDWLGQTEEQLVLGHCAYWLSLRGAGPTDSTSSIRISIPRQNLFSVETLRSMMDRLGKGQDL